MIFDRFRKKKHKPTGNGDSSLETVDISGQVPNVDDVLAQVDKALKEASKLENQLRPPDRCGC